MSDARFIKSIFDLRRVLAHLVKDVVLRDSPLGLEDFELLTLLSESEDYVSYRDLKRTLSTNAALFTRRVQDLKELSYVEIEDEAGTNSKKARITQAGRALMQPLREKYEAFCNRVLAEVDEKDADVLINVYDGLTKRLRWEA